MSAMTDALLRRRPAAFFKGKVLRLGPQTAPEGWPTGYYLLVDITEGNQWHYHYCGDSPPPKEPIYDYHTVGQEDLWALPSTVFPKKTFWGWSIFPATLCILVCGVGGQFGPDAAQALPLSLMMFVPMWVFAVGWKWLDNIEPVFATKTLLVWVVIMTVWSGRSERTNQEVVSDQQTRMLG